MHNLQNSGCMGFINGYKVYVLTPVPIYKQVRFPKTKKKRVRKKWKQKKWNTEMRYEYACKPGEVITDIVHGAIYIHPRDQHMVRECAPV